MFPRILRLIVAALLAVLPARAAEPSINAAAETASEESAAIQAIGEIRATATSPEELVARQVAVLQRQRAARVLVPEDPARKVAVSVAMEAASTAPGLDEKARVEFETAAALLEIEAGAPDPAEMVRRQVEFLQRNAKTPAEVSALAPGPEGNVEPVASLDRTEIGREALAIGKIERGVSAEEIVRRRLEFQQRKANAAPQSSPAPISPEPAPNTQ